MTSTLGAALADIDWNGHMDLDGGWWIVMGIGMIVFWALVILGIVWLVRELAHPREARPATSDPDPFDPDPFAILDRRLAAGEISPEEYRERRAMLRGEPSTSSDDG